VTVESAADRASMLADFGVTATYSGGTFTAIFDNDYEAVEAGGGVPVAALNPRITCRTADVSTLSDGDSLTIDSALYVIAYVMPDGTGVTAMILEAQ